MKYIIIFPIIVGAALAICGIMYVLWGGSDGTILPRPQTPAPIWLRLSFGILLIYVSIVGIVYEMKGSMLRLPYYIDVLAIFVLLVVSIYGFTTS